MGTTVSVIPVTVSDAHIVAVVKAGNFVPRTYVWYNPGALIAGTEQAPTYIVERACVIEDIELHVKTAPTGAALIVDLNAAGASLYSTKPRIAIAEVTKDGNEVRSAEVIGVGEELTMDIDQIGSTVTGADLSVLLHVKEAVL